MDVGVNYPWDKYGWDFGQAPPFWRGGSKNPLWLDRIDADLECFQKLGIKVVRWFILADGLTYGAPFSAPRPDSTNPGQWRFNPPPLSRAFSDHFLLLLNKFVAFNKSPLAPILLLPVLIDYQFCQDGEQAKAQKGDPLLGWIKKGRADAINDASKQRLFLDRVLNPLLALSLYHPEVIYAWELINEPELVTKGWWLPRYKEPPTIEEEAMRSFLAEGLGRIWSSRFKATIGFNRLETILNTEIITDLNQFHHYPEHRFFDRELPKRLGPQFFGSELPLIVGEFATSLTEHTWPELPTQRVLEKLRRAESLGYPMAMPWSFINQDPKKDLNSVWTPQVESDIECFTQGRNC